ncbi:MAG: hypothetical protein ACLKAN_13550 [Alkaliphilus sp.]
MVNSSKQVHFVCGDCGHCHDTEGEADDCCIPQQKVIGCGEIIDDWVKRDDDGSVIDDGVIRCEKDGKLCEDCKKEEDAILCRNCGHRKDWHFESRRTGYGCNIPNCDCDCKEFIISGEAVVEEKK